MMKRLFDLFFALIGTLLLLPVFLVIACLIKIDSPGPVFFRQERVGRGGVLFRIHKLRTMRNDTERHGQLTVGNDARVTRVGFYLRKYKIDELAQLVDVLQGTMSLVGPRPEVPKFVDCYSEQDRLAVLSVAPGITDLASIEFKDEAAILADSTDPHRDYVEKILPIKIGYYKRYVAKHTLLGDLGIIFKTLKAVFVR